MSLELELRSTTTHLSHPQLVLSIAFQPKPRTHHPSTHLKRSFIISGKIPKYYYYGKRKSQIMHTRLRTNCSVLSHDLFSKNIIQSPLCSCGEEETASHYFLHCPLYSTIRVRLLNCVSHFCLPSTKVLLFGNPILSLEDNCTIFAAVHTFIDISKRFDKTPSVPIPTLL
jgi:hypothetical protein